MLCRTGSAPRASNRDNFMSHAKPLSLAVPPHFLLAVRLAVTLIWLYEGLWQKIIVQDAHELAK